MRYIRGHQSRKNAPQYRVDENGCWVWLWYIDERGYARIRQGKGTARAHRVYYERKHGPIPDGLVIDHRCHNEDTSCAGGPTCPHRRCVNPDHLEPVTGLVNARRGRTPGRKPLP